MNKANCGSYIYIVSRISNVINSCVKEGQIPIAKNYAQYLILEHVKLYKGTFSNDWKGNFMGRERVNELLEWVEELCTSKQVSLCKGQIILDNLK